MREEIGRTLIRASRRLARTLERLVFPAPVRFVYNPLLYARAPYESYLMKFADSRKRVLFLGMNPGPWGMAQTGVPFGEVSVVRDWLAVVGKVGAPPSAHPRVPVLGYQCPRSEVSGRRLWNLMRGRFGSASSFFANHFVTNYCPLLFLDESGRNLTPDTLKAGSRDPLFEACDLFLTRTIEALRPEWVVGVGRFAEARLRAVVEPLSSLKVAVSSIPHPSPASPLANSNWPGRVSTILSDLGIW